MTRRSMMLLFHKIFFLLLKKFLLVLTWLRLNFLFEYHKRSRKYMYLYHSKTINAISYKHRKDFGIIFHVVMCILLCSDKASNTTHHVTNETSIFFFRLSRCTSREQYAHYIIKVLENVSKKDNFLIIKCKGSLIDITISLLRILVHISAAMQKHNFLVKCQKLKLILFDSVLESIENLTY